jgi:uncharacterized protein YciW
MSHIAEDVIDATSGVTEGSPLDALRAARPEVRARTQSSYAALFDSAGSGGLPAHERFAVAMRVAQLHKASTLAVHYRDRLALEAQGEQTAAGVTARLAAILRHADKVTLRPADATRADLNALAAQGLGEAEIVTLSQIIAFVAYQVRVAASLALIAEFA